MSHTDESYLPEFPASVEDADSPLDPVSVPSEVTFAEEVRADRLSLLWKITLAVSFIVGWLLVVIEGGSDLSPIQLLLPCIILAAGCLLTARFLPRDQFTLAVWTYALGMLVTIGLVTTIDGESGSRYAPYLYLLVILVVGPLVPVRTLFVMLALIFLAAFGFPNLFSDGMVFSATTFFAMALATIAAGLSAQVSGELYAIAEWALDSYRRERRTTFALFDSREALVEQVPTPYRTALQDVGGFKHVLTHMDLHLHPVLVELPADVAASPVGQWFGADQWPHLGLPAPVRVLLQA